MYFVDTRQFTDLKWGTQNPVILRDAEFGMARLRAFGGYAIRVVEAVALLRELAGTDPHFRTEEVSDHLRTMVVGKLGPAIAAAGVPVLDLVTQQEQIASKVANALNLELREVGIEVSKLVIENISVPPEVEAAMDKRTQMGVLGNLDDYTRFQSANAIEAAANNQGGAGEGFGIGIGVALGQRAGGQQQPPQAPPPQTPPPLPQGEQWSVGANGQQLGPFDRAGLGAQISAGTLTRATLVWQAGMAQWIPAARAPEVSALFGATPPPLPPRA